MAYFPQPTRLLQPAEALLHFLARSLPELIGLRLHAPQQAASGFTLRAREWVAALRMAREGRGLCLGGSLVLRRANGAQPCSKRYSR